jgi:hypothetical protein
VFAEIAADRRATWQALGVLVAASLIGGWRFLWPGDGGWHVRQWLLEEAGVAIISTLAGAGLLWVIARLAGGSGTVLGLWRGMAFALAPIALGAFGFIGVWVGAALALPFLVRAVAETQKVRTSRRSSRSAFPSCSTPRSYSSSSSCSAGIEGFHHPLLRRIGLGRRRQPGTGIRGNHLGHAKLAPFAQQEQT